MRLFLIALTLSSLSLVASCSSVKSQEEDKARLQDEQKQKQEQQLEAKLESIGKELEALKNHPWAGAYFQGDGTGANLRLAIAPQSGAAFCWAGCLGTYQVNYGNVTVQDQRVRFQWDISPVEKELFDTCTELLVVPWGERCYLIPLQEILEFTADVRGKWEPREQKYGRWFMRVGDEKRPAPGQPTLPKGFERYLNMKAIKATLISINAESQTHSIAQKQDWITLTVTLNAGSDAGVLPKMRFEVLAPEGVHLEAVITEVRQRESIAVIKYTDQGSEQGQKRPAIGWTFVSPKIPKGLEE